MSSTSAFTAIRDHDLRNELSNENAHSSSDALARHTLTILASTVAAIAIGATFAFVSTPTYEATASVFVQEPGIDPSSLALPADSHIKRFVSSSAAILRSRAVLIPVVENLQLNVEVTPHSRPLFTRIRNWFGNSTSVASPNIQFSSFPSELVGIPLHLIPEEHGRYEIQDSSGTPIAHGRIGESAQLSMHSRPNRPLIISRLGAVSGEEFRLLYHQPAEVVSLLQTELDIAASKENASILEVRFRSPDPHLATAVVDRIADSYVQFNSDLVKQKIAPDLALFEDNLSLIEGDLNTAENALREFIDDGRNAEFRREAHDALAKLQEYELIRRALRPELDSLAQEPSHSVSSLVDLDQRLQDTYKEFGRISRGPGLLARDRFELMYLARRLDSFGKLYASLARAVVRLRSETARSMTSIRVADYADLPSTPIWPDKPMILLGFTFVGLALGIFAVFIRLPLRSVVFDPLAIEKHSRLPVLSCMPQHRLQRSLSNGQTRFSRNRASIASSAPTEPAIASLKAAMSACHQNDRPDRGSSVMITGPSPECGKSFIALNLAAILALQGKRVLLVDGDLRGGDLHVATGVNARYGLADLLAGKADLYQCVHRTSIENMDIIASGTRPRDPAELMLRCAFKEHLKEASSQYDFLVVDSPPFPATTDAAIIGKAVESTLLVVAEGQHTERELRDLARSLLRSGIRARGIVLNNVTSGVRHGVTGLPYQERVSFG